MSNVNPLEEEKAFISLLQNCFRDNNEMREVAEKTYHQIPDEEKITKLISVLCNTTIDGQIRTFAATILRRLIRRQFTNVWSKFSPDQQATLKTQLLDQIIQISDDEIVRKNICLVTAELAKNLKDENNQVQWPELVKCIAQAANSSENKLHQSVLIIIEAFPDIFASQDEQLTETIHRMFYNCLNNQDTKVRNTAMKSFAAYLKHYCENVQLFNIYGDCLPSVISTIQSFNSSNGDTALKELINIAENSPKYLRPSIDDIFKSCLEIMKKKTEFDESHRHLALEVLITLSERGSGMIPKVNELYLNELVSQLLDMMADLNDDPKWSTKDEIEDVTEIRNAFIGEESLDRFACTLDGKVTFNYLLKTVGTMLRNNDWRFRYAGLMALSTTCEGFHKEIFLLLDDLVDSLLLFLNDSHPRVRYAACNVLGRMSRDFEGNFQEKFHSKMIPGLLLILNDYENPRTQAHGAGALVNFVQGSSSQLLVKYLPEIIEKLDQVFNQKYAEFFQHNHKLVLEGIITALAAVANIVVEDFTPYYDRFLPRLKYLFQKLTTLNYPILYGKTMECISLIGLAVGKEKFINDCHEIMSEFAKAPIDFEFLGYNDPKISYFIGSWKCVCKILGKDFAQYLPIVMKPVLKIATFQSEVMILPENTTVTGENDSWEENNVDNQIIGLEGKLIVCSTLLYYTKKLKEDFADYVEDTTKLMIQLFRCYFHKGIRNIAIESLPYLLDCVKLRENEYVRQLWQYMKKEIFQAVEIERDPGVLGEIFLSLSKCIEILNVSKLTADDLKEITTMIVNQLKKHLERSNERAEQRQDKDYDEDSKAQMIEQDTCDAYTLIRLSNIIHSFLIIYKNSYLVYFDALVPYFNTLIQSTHSISDRLCALRVFDDIIQFTGPWSHRYSHLFLSHMIKSLADSSPKIRQAAAYGFGVMAMNGGSIYTDECAKALPLLIALIDAQNSRSPGNNLATENAISAVTKIFKYNNSFINNIDELLPVWFSCLPIDEETQEISYIYSYLCDLIESNNPIIIDKNNSNVDKLIKLIEGALAKPSIKNDSMLDQRMMFILQKIQAANTHVSSTSISSYQNISSLHIITPRLASTVNPLYRNNNIINEALQLVPHLLLSERSLEILRKCDKPDDTKNDIIQHINERIQAIEITVDEKKTKYYSTDGTSYKSADNTYILKINKELFEDCINDLSNSNLLAKAKLRLTICICHEFVHHKMHKYFLDDRWSKAIADRTPPDVGESGFYWEKNVIGGRFVKTDNTNYSILTIKHGKIEIDDGLCQFFSNKMNYDDENFSAYDRKEKQKLQSGVSNRSSRRNIERLYLNLNGTQKLPKTKSDSYITYRVTPRHPISAEITMENETNDDIFYDDVPQNCGSLHAYLFKYNEDNGEMFTVDLPINEHDWTCAAMRERRHRVIPHNILEIYIQIKPGESRTFTIKIMEVTTENEEDNMKITGHYFLEIQIGYHGQHADDLHFGKKAIEFNVEYDNGKSNDENMDTEQELPVLKN